MGTGDAAVDVVVTTVRARLGGADSWPEWPGGYPESVALCVIDSIQSMGVRYGSVGKVVRRYREQFPNSADRKASGLAQSFAKFGGPDGWAEAVGNRHRTSTRNRHAQSGFDPERCRAPS